MHFGERRLRRGAVALATVAALAALAAPAVARSPFTGTGVWIWYVRASSHGDPAALGARAARSHVSTAFVNSSDGTYAWSQFTPALVAALHARGLRVCAWQYVYGKAPRAEAALGARAVRRGADCLVIDAEVEYEGRYGAAQTYLRALRTALPARFPVGLAGFPYVDYHPAFPYSVFLGPGGAQFDLPQMYWRDIAPRSTGRSPTPTPTTASTAAGSHRSARPTAIPPAASSSAPACSRGASRRAG